MNTLFTGMALWINCDERFNPYKIKVFLELPPGIIHTFLRCDLRMVNKFLLLIFGKNSVTNHGWTRIFCHERTQNYKENGNNRFLTTKHTKYSKKAF